MAHLKNFNPLSRPTQSYSRSESCLSLLVGGVWHEENEIVKQMIPP